MHGLVVLLALFVSATCGSRPRIAVDLKKAEDIARVTSRRGATVVAIDSKSGIGAARLLRRGASWPKRLTVRLNVKGLESLRMDNGALRFETSLGSPRQVPYTTVGEGGAPGGTLTVDLVRTKDAVEIVVPGKLLESNPDAIGVAWIDFFRG